MNLVGSYAHHHHHHHPHPAHPMLHEPFLFGPASRCHQERPYFQSWLLSPADAAPDFSAGGPPPTTAVAAAAYGPDVRPGQSPGRLEALGGRLPRRKGSGPKKERRRTESINSAFAELRECIPNVPADTKLSKIKTLRLATSYIAYLMDVLAKDAQAGDPEAFKAELKKADGGRESKRKRELVSPRVCKLQPRVRAGLRAGLQTAGKLCCSGCDFERLGRVLRLVTVCHCVHGGEVESQLNSVITE